ncbi:MAG: hypothetical protein AAFO02_06425, partial [Bacteroidota bacterium]
ECLFVVLSEYGIDEFESTTNRHSLSVLLCHIEVPVYRSIPPIGNKKKVSPCEPTLFPLALSSSKRQRKRQLGTSKNV